MAHIPDPAPFDAGDLRSPAPSARVPDHELIQLIGQGGCGEVWLARNILGAFRGVKIVHEATFRHKRPFEREFNGVKKFEPISRLHEGLMDVLQVGRDDAAGYFYCVMELADDVRLGQDIRPEEYSPRTLAADLKRCPRLPTMECLQIGANIATALKFLHDRGLVHRDLKPSNIVFVNGVPKLGDVGLVAELAEATSYVGTDGFIPPEGPGTAQADLYSLGKVLYELSTGKDRRDYPELPTQFQETAHEQEQVELNRIILKACRTNPRERYGSADEMMADLLAVQQGGRIRPDRKRSLTSAAWMLGAACVCGVAWLVMGSHGTKPAREEALFGLSAAPRLKASGPASLPPGLVAWWSAEDDAIDSVSGGAGTMMNGAGFSTNGIVGGAFDLDGVDDYLRVGNRPELRLTGPMTIEGWVCQRTNGSMQSIVSKWGVVLGKDYRSYIFGCLQSGRLSFGVSPFGVGPGCQAVMSAAPLPLNEWTHVAATYDGNQLRVYLNGMRDGLLAYTNGIFPGTNEVTIGANVDYEEGKFMAPFAGRIDEISVYNRGLSDAEIQAIFDAGRLGKRMPAAAPSGPGPAGLIGWWRGEGDARDSARGHDGVLKNGASFAFGKFGQAFSFDGKDDCVMIPRADELDVGSEVTIDCWIKADPRNLMDECCQGLVTTDFYALEIAPGDTWVTGVNFALITDHGTAAELLDREIVGPSLVMTRNTNDPPAAIRSGEWHYLAGTYDGTGAQLYVDGKPWGKRVAHTGRIFPMLRESFLTLGSEDGRTFCPFCVGRRYFKGLLDEVRVFNRALPAEEIAASYEAAGRAPQVAAAVSGR